MSGKLKETLISSDPSLIEPFKADTLPSAEKPSAENTETENASDDVKKDFIKSHLPLKHALKLAWGSIKQKPIRLAFTVLLSVIAFTLFGISSSLMLYEQAYSISSALKNSDYESVILNKEFTAHYTQTTLQDKGYKNEEKNVTLTTSFTQSDVDAINDNDEGLLFAGIIDLGKYDNVTADSVGKYSAGRFALDECRVNAEYGYYYCVDSLIGFSDCGDAFLAKNGFAALAGSYPQTKNEIAVPYYIYDYYAHSQYDENDANSKLLSVEEIIGKTISFGGIPLTVSGVYDVGNLPEQYDELLNKNSELDYLTKKTMSAQFADILENGFHTLAYVSEDFYAEHKYDNASIGYSPTFGFSISDNSITYNVDEKSSVNVITPRSARLYGEIINFYDFNGNKIQMPDNPKPTDVYVCADSLLFAAKDFYTILSTTDVTDPDLLEIKNVLSKIDKNFSFYKLDKTDVVTLAEKTLGAYEKFYGKTLQMPNVYYAKNSDGQSFTLDVKGYFVIAKGNSSFNSRDFFISDELRDEYSITISAISSGSVTTIYETDYELSPKNEKYGKIISLSDHSLSKTRYVLNGGTNGATYAMSNNVYVATSSVSGIIYQMKKLFYISGAIIGLFAAIMLFNFITVSISAKAKEIGILRAVGANKFDVMKIFFAETLLIALTCFIVSAVLSGAACALINAYTVENALKITVLNYNAINVAILLSMSLVVSVLSTAVPVLKVANKPPVEGIRV